MIYSRTITKVRKFSALTAFFAVFVIFSVDNVSASESFGFSNQNLSQQNYASQSSLKRKRQAVPNYQERRLRKTQQKPFDAPLNLHTFGNQPSQAMRPSGSGLNGSGTVVVPNR